MFGPDRRPATGENASTFEAAVGDREDQVLDDEEREVGKDCEASVRRPWRNSDGEVIDEFGSGDSMRVEAVPDGAASSRGRHVGDHAPTCRRGAASPSCYEVRRNDPEPNKARRRR